LGVPEIVDETLRLGAGTEAHESKVELRPSESSGSAQLVEPPPPCVRGSRAEQYEKHEEANRRFQRSHSTSAGVVQRVNFAKMSPRTPSRFRLGSSARTILLRGTDAFGQKSSRCACRSPRTKHDSPPHAADSKSRRWPTSNR